jgi:hypothetical protein
LNISRALATEIMYLNDDCTCNSILAQGQKRWARVRRWVEKNIIP